MQAIAPLSLGWIGAALALGGLVTLMLGEPQDPHRVAAAAACLVCALGAFAVDGLMRLGRRAYLALRPPPEEAPPAAIPAMDEAPQPDEPETKKKKRADQPVRGETPRQGALAAARDRREERRS